MMTTGHVFIAASLDGYIARSNGDVEWLEKYNSEEALQSYNRFIEPMDGLVMGRGTYEKVRTFGEWPYTKPVIVISRTLTQADIPSELIGKIEISSGTPEHIMGELHSRGWSRACIDGGKLIQSFISKGLIETLWITQIPILLGDGIRLFGNSDNETSLELLKAETFSGLVSAQYRVTRQG